ncbi:MAG TPA: sce7726 family protein [Novosphingobium sp.]|nr:sce7726 family protein [Novosphingobium sp.]
MSNVWQGDSIIYSAAQFSALTRLFSAAVFHEMAKKGRSSLFSRLVAETNLRDHCGTEATVGEAFDSAFDVLKVAGQRDEYIYRSAISHKILMGTHSLQTASMLNEFRAGSCKADLVILNGTATVYEIKSERDSLARLANQVENYKRVFAKVNVIASEGHVDGVLATVPDDVGVMCLSRRYRISTVREAVDRPARICPVTVFESLRSAEAIAILKALGIAVPQVPNTQRHAALRALFADLDPATLHVEMVHTLKRTRNLAPLGELVDRLPGSLQAAALSIPVRRTDHDRIVEAVETPLGAAMAWS